MVSFLDCLHNLESQGMEDLIRQAFLHVDIIGPHVVEGHYDLIGPNSEIILPGVWETVIEPDWTITMHMWPMPEPKLEDPDAVIQVPEPAAAPPPEKKGKNKRRVTPAVPAVDVPPPPPPLPLAPDGVIDAQAGMLLNQNPLTLYNQRMSNCR